MEIGLFDILLFVLPFFIVNILLVLYSTSHFPIKSTIPLVMMSYSLLLTTFVFSLVIIFHFHFEDSVALHVHELSSPTIISILSLNIDLLGVTILIFGGSIIISGLILSQIAMFMLNKYYSGMAVSDICFQDIIKNNFSESTQKLINQTDIEFIILKEDFPFIFTFSYYKFLSRKNVIIIASNLIDLLEIKELEVSVMHEIGHIVHKDTISNPIFNAISKIMFFDPFLKKIKYKYREKIEIRADDFVKKNHPDYSLLGSSLIKINKCVIDYRSKSNQSFYRNYEVSSKKHLQNRLKNLKKINVN
jgi:hypothetical protein